MKGGRVIFCHRIVVPTGAVSYKSLKAEGFLMPDSQSSSSAAAPGAAETIALSPSGPLAEALKGGIGEAIEALDHTDPVRAVHDLRKAFKRLRALLRLVETGGGDKDGERAKMLRRALAEGARLVAGARDVVARRDALDDLVAKGLLPLPLRRSAGRSLAPATRRKEDHLAPHRTELQVLLTQLVATLPRLGGALDDKALIAALAAEFGKARKIGRKLDPEDDEELHELRKAVVAQRYQMELATPAWPTLGKAWVEELQRLRDKLGKHHDLSVLIARLQARPPRAPAQHAWHGPLMQAAHARQHKLARSALRLHARLFAERPGAFRRRLAAYMTAMSHRE
jgi:CHAD domain-containing protein